MKCSAYVNYENDTIAAIKYELANKGIGPAILGDVRYIFGDKDYESYSIDKGIIEKYDSLVFIEIAQNMQIDSSVFQPDEELTVFTIYLTAKKQENTWVFNRIANELSVQFCYCSVYGDCWYRGRFRTPQKREECRCYINY